MVRSFGDGRYPAVYRRSSAPCRAAVWYHGKLADSRLEVDVRMPAERREFAKSSGCRAVPPSALPGQRQNALFRAGQGPKCANSQAHRRCPPQAKNPTSVPLLG
jgi:hypothetical protein